MATRRDRLTGVAALLGGLLVVLVSVPSSWYGLRPHDSYVFSPPAFSPLWIARYVVPALAVVTALALLAGLAGLVARDWGEYGRAGRWGGGAAVVGAGLLALAAPAFFVGVGRPSGTKAILVLATVLLGALGTAAVGIGLVALGFVYRMDERPRLASVFFAAVVLPPILGYLMPSSLTVVVAMVPVGLAWVTIGVELLGYWPDVE